MDAIYLCEVTVLPPQYCKLMFLNSVFKYFVWVAMGEKQFMSHLLYFILFLFEVFVLNELQA